MKLEMKDKSQWADEYDHESSPSTARSWYYLKHGPAEVSHANADSMWYVIISARILVLKKYFVMRFSFKVSRSWAQVNSHIWSGIYIYIIWERVMRFSFKVSRSWARMKSYINSFMFSVFCILSKIKRHLKYIFQLSVYHMFRF